MIKKLLKNKRLVGGASLYLILLVVVYIFGFLLVSGRPAPKTNNSDAYIPEPNSDILSKKNLQLKTLKFVTPTSQPTIPQSITPQPTTPQLTIIPVPTITNNCENTSELGIFIGFDPGPDGKVGSSGNIRVWVTDELPNFISPGEFVDPTTGAITPGNRTAKDSKGILWEPAIYVTPLSSSNQSGPYSGDEENGGTPYFPILIKGDYNPHPPNRGGIMTYPKGPAIDSDYINYKNGPDWSGSIWSKGLQVQQYIGEYIWDTKSFKHGTNRIQIIIHDGDGDYTLTCGVNIQI